MNSNTSKCLTYHRITVDDISNVIGYRLTICPLRFPSCAGGSIASIYTKMYCLQRSHCVRHAVGHLLANAAEASKDEMQMQTKTDAGPAILDFEAAAFALSSSLRAAFAETLRLATRLWIQWICPAFAFYSRLRFSVSQ